MPIIRVEGDVDVHHLFGSTSKCRQVVVGFWLEALHEAFAHAGRSRSFFYVPELYRKSADLLTARGDGETARLALEQAEVMAREQTSPLLAARVAASFERIEGQAV